MDKIIQTTKGKKEIDENVKALVFSGHFDTPVVANYEEYGFVGRIEKPITFNQFLTEIAKVIKNWFKIIWQSHFNERQKKS